MAPRAASLCLCLLAATTAVAEDKLPAEEPAVWTRHEVVHLQRAQEQGQAAPQLHGRARRREDPRARLRVRLPESRGFPAPEDHVLGADAAREGRQGPGRAGPRRLEAADDQAQLSEG